MSSSEGGQVIFLPMESALGMSAATLIHLVTYTVANFKYIAIWLRIYLLSFSELESIQEEGSDRRPAGGCVSDRAGAGLAWVSGWGCLDRSEAARLPARKCLIIRLFYL